MYYVCDSFVLYIYSAQPWLQVSLDARSLRPTPDRQKKESKSIYIVLFYQASQSAPTRITQFYLQITPCLPFPRKRSPDVATPNEVADI